MTVGRSSLGWLRQPASLQRLLRWGLLMFFVWLTGRFWHPCYGFTRFIQLDDSDAAVMLPELRDAPVYVYHYSGGYDGVAYAQIAVRPAVHDPELARAVDSLPLRARRILLSWVAYGIGLGNAVRIVQVYAVLNLVIWFVLAALLAKIFPPVDWRNLVAWTGLLFSAGVLHSVRLALTDLAAFALLAWAVWLAGRRREGVAAGLLGAAGLVRETALLGGVALLPADWRQNPGRTLARLALAALPLGLWMLYLRKITGPVVHGLVNFGWPFLGWLEKSFASLRQIGTEPDKWLAITTLLAFAGLTVQALYVALRPGPRDPWWRLGVVYGGLMLCLGTAVWAGHPGAATRILLPLGLAFNVLAVRRQAAAVWLVAGNLTVFSGVLALWEVPQDAHELAAGRANPGSYVVHTDARWYPAEHGHDKTWAWCSEEGGLDLDLWPRTAGSVTMRLDVRGFTARPLEIRQDGRTIWSGRVEEKLQWIELPAVAVAHGRARLELNSSARPIRENVFGDSRELGFALYGVRVE
jgi:hypothetical protein